MAGLKRTDNKGRILKDGETQRKDGTYRFTYTDADGVRHDVYSKRLVPTDRLPPGCKDDLCLREKERKINRDLEDGIKAAVENKATLNDLFELYMANKPELKDTTRSNYLYMYNKYVRNDIGKKKVPVMLIGAGEAGSIILNEIKKSTYVTKTIRCIIDDDPAKKGTYLSGIPVVGNRNTILRNAVKFDVEEIILQFRQ